MMVGYQLLRATPRSKFRDAHFFCTPGLSKCEHFWEISVSISDGILLTRTSVTGQQNINIQTQIKYKVIVSQVSVVMSQVAHRKGWKRGFARGQVASGKWFLQESLLIPNFLKCFKNNFFFQETSSFWLLENAKNPTDLKPYWSRAGLRHPYICLFWITICCRWFVYFYIYMSAWNTNEFVQPATGDKHPVQPTQGRSTLYSWGKFCAPNFP